MPIHADSHKSIKRKTIKGFFWSFGETFGRYGIGVLITIFLARLLTPKDYGLIGLISVFFAIATAIVDGGFRQALIRKIDVSQTDKSTVFYTNLIVSVIIYTLLFASAPLIAAFFKESRLIGLVRFMGIQIIIYAFQIVQVAELTRRMDFKTQVKITLPSGIISGLIAIILAWKGYGVWSLAIQTVLGSLFTTIFYWIHNRWMPSFEFSRNSLKDFFSFSSNLLLSSLLDTIFNNLYSFIIGKFFSAQQLGYYSFSMKIKHLGAEQITLAIQRVSFPALSLLQNETQKLKSGYRKIMQCSVFVVFPLVTFIALAAEPLFNIFLNEKWLPAIPYLRILCIVGAMYPLHAINLNVLNVKKRSDLFLKLEIIKKILQAIILLITTPFGIFHLLIGQAVLSVLSYFLNSHYTAKLIDYSVYRQLKDIFPILISSTLMAITMHISSFLASNNDILRLIIILFFGTAAYLFSCNIMKTEAYSIIYDILSKKFPGPKKRKCNTNTDTLKDYTPSITGKSDE